MLARSARRVPPAVAGKAAIALASRFDRAARSLPISTARRVEPDCWQLE